jgi:hypothetical protein
MPRKIRRLGDQAESAALQPAADDTETTELKWALLFHEVIVYSEDPDTVPEVSYYDLTLAQSGVTNAAGSTLLRIFDTEEQVNEAVPVFLERYISTIDPHDGAGQLISNIHGYEFPDLKSILAFWAAQFRETSEVRGKIRFKADGGTDIKTYMHFYIRPIQIEVPKKKIKGYAKDKRVS